MAQTYARGSTVTFTHSFLGPTGDPMVAVDASYPQVQIEDPDGAIAASGVGIATGVPGTWQFQWTVPLDAVCSDDWKLVWALTDLQYDSHTDTSAFKVVPTVEGQDGLDRTGSYLTKLGTTERIIWKGDFDPYDISLVLEMADGTVCLDKPKTELQTVQQDCYVHYYADTLSLDCQGQYLITWRYRKTELSPFVYETQSLLVPYREFWFNAPHLRLLIDKLNKVTTTPLSYLDSELHKYMQQGLGLLNSVHPLTDWRWNSVPGTFHTWWILLSGLWALNSRQLLEIEVQHVANGQTVTLEYDHVSPLSDVISRWQDMIRDWLIPAKTAAFRQACGPGLVAVRPYRLQYYNRVYRNATSNQALQDFPALLSRLGLWF